MRHLKICVNSAIFFSAKGISGVKNVLLQNLKNAGLSFEEIAPLRIGDLYFENESYRIRRKDGRICDVGEAEVARQYFQRRAELDLDCSPSAPLIIDLRGREVTAEGLEKYLIRARTVRVALQANGSFCAAVLAARKGKN